MKNKILKITGIVIICICVSLLLGYSIMNIVLDKQFKSNDEAMIEHLNSLNTDSNDIKNVILLIGDGMGFNQLEETKILYNLDSLYLETLPHASCSATKSLANDVTDSAAGATALSTGNRVFNGEVAKRGSTTLKTITQYAHSSGLKTGIITTDDCYGATPAAFSSYTIKRSNYDTIVNRQIKSNVDYLVSSVVNGNLTDKKAASLQKNGYTYVKTEEELLNASGDKIFGVLDTLHSSYVDSNYTELQIVAQNAIDFLDNDNGFFLMIEGARIDKFNHANDAAGMASELIDFDNTVKYCVEWARSNRNTAVIVTADHESGGLILTPSGYEYTTTHHTGVDVPLYTYGFTIDKSQYLNVNIFSMCKWAITKQ